ncbi:hypothetical protein RYX36_012965 [Vicia faba]
MDIISSLCILHYSIQEPKMRQKGHLNLSSRGSKGILGDYSHIYIYENRGIASIGETKSKTVRNIEEGTSDFDLIKATIQISKEEAHLFDHKSHLFGKSL